MTLVAHADPLAPYRIVGDTVPEPLVATAVDAFRGNALIRDRAGANCLICHAIPEPSERFMGDLGPDLRGVGSRLSPAQLRFRLIDQSRLNPATLMPPYYRIDGLLRVGPQYRDKPVLTAAEIEDVVAYLVTLKE